VAGILTEYVRAAMQHAHYEILTDDGTFYGEIPELQGVLANAETLESCREELAEALEEWIIIGLLLGHRIPELDNIDLNIAVPT
jgi:predicted RNase H-like HicB family nuclease